MKIGAFAELTGISAYTLRYYEKKGLLFVKRGQNGCRNYLAEDREWVQFLCKHQVYVAEEVHKWQQYSENLQAKIAVYQEQLLQQRQNAGLK